MLLYNQNLTQLINFETLLPLYECGACVGMATFKTVHLLTSVAVLDDLDKELNNYNMRCREWYGWHFPELGKLISDNTVYAKTVRAIGRKDGISKVDLSAILPEEVEQEVREQAEISMGSDVSCVETEQVLQL